VLFASVALGTTGYLAAVSVSTLAARAITGSPLLAGSPSAVAVIGTALGSSLISADAVRAGRRRGMVTGYALGAFGAAVAAFATFTGSLLLLLTGLFVLGFGQASSQLARYAAAEVTASSGRGSAVATIVWAGTIGAVVGPSLLDTAGSIAASWNTATYLGGYLIAAVFMGLAFCLQLVAFRPPSITAGSAREARTSWAATAGGLRDPRIQVGMILLVFGQVVMVLIMTGTPIHIEDGGGGLDLVGFVISAHTLGMFAFSPITGRLVDALGAHKMLVASVVVLGTSAVISATAPGDRTWQLTTGLLLLGIGWNMGFVAGSSIMSSHATPQLQGLVDSTVWIASASAALSSGVLLQFVGYPALSLTGLALLVVPGSVLLARRRAVPAF
jgi:MFS family permease